MKNSCITCKFFIALEGVKGAGSCTRYPPTPMLAEITDVKGTRTVPSAMWPLVRDHEHCGEYVPHLMQ